MPKGKTTPRRCGHLRAMTAITSRNKTMKSFDESVEFESLYDSMWKCKRGGKIKKASVARFVTHGIEETLKLEDQIRDGTYLPRKPHTFTLTYPKVRPCSSTHIRDRIVQRSLNDEVIYPAMVRTFIWDNMACQKGKGTTRAMDRIDQFLHRYYINNGNSTEGWVLQFDVEGYYRSMRSSWIAKQWTMRRDGFRDNIHTKSDMSLGRRWCRSSAYRC